MTAWILSSCALIAAIMLLRRLLRGRMDPRLTYALWLLVALRVLIPTSLFTAPVSVSGLAERSGVTEAVETVREAVTPKQTLVGSLPENSGVTLDEYADSFNSSGIHVYDVAPFTDTELSEIRKENPAFYTDTANQPLKITAELIIGNLTFWRWVYAAGAFVVFLVLLRCNLKFYARLRRSRRLYEGELPVSCSLPVYVASGLPSPCLFGLIHPAIYLNDAALGSGHLDHVLVHELTHRRHLDHWWALVRCACLAVQWFNPLVWIAAGLSRQDCETACDASAIRRLGEPERLSYGRTLVGMIAAGSRRPSALLETATTMTGSVSSIRERVTLIAKKPRMTAVTLVSVLLIAALAVGCTFGGTKPSEPSGGTPDAPTETPDVSAFDSAPLFDLPESLRDKVTVVKGEADQYGVTLASYYMTADYDPDSDDDSWGRLCYVRQLTDGQFEDAYLSSCLGISQRFPGRDGQFFYEVCSPSDVPFSDSVYAELEGVYDILYGWLDGIFAADPAISPIDLSATPFVDDFSYGGNHMDVTIYPYNDPENPDAKTWTLVLSQPVTQGEGGIWCAERLYYGGTDTEPYYILPDTDLTAAEYYAQLQAQADGGQAVDCSTAALSPDDVTARYFTDRLNSYSAAYSDVYSADKGASRADGMGAAITGPVTPADQAKNLYAAIAGDTTPRPFTMEVDDGGVTRVDVPGAGEAVSWTSAYTGNYLADFDWQVSFSDRAPSGASLTMASADGQRWLRCWSDSDLVLLHQDGGDTWMTAAPPSGPDSSQTVYQTLLRVAETVLRQQAFDVAVPESAAGDGPTAEAGVLLAYTRQVVENLKALPDWVRCKPLDAAVKSVTVTQYYFGSACPNFCAAYALYLDVGAPMSARAGEWQAGAGLDTETEGDYAGWSVWYIGSHFYYDAQSRAYRCSGRYTGGEALFFPRALDEATLEELLDDLNFTSSGNDHDNRIPRIIFERFSLRELNAALLAYHPDEPWRANTIAKSLGTFLSRETGSDIPAYDTVYAALDRRFRPYLEEGSKETPPESVTYYAADYS